MATLKQYVCDTYGRENIAENGVNKMKGNNGAWVSIELKDGNRHAIPVSKKEASQEADINEYNIFMTDDGVAIATISSVQQVVGTLDFGAENEQATASAEGMKLEV